MTESRTASPKRAVHGVLLLDKPPDMTSNQALQIAKRLLAAKKAGHTGSLDPIATGLLPLCFGDATKFCQFLLEADKHYQVQAQLGIRTNTGDKAGTVLARRPVAAFEAAALETVLARFRGHISQTPPMFSALKLQGKPLYQLARTGVTVERTPRTLTIHCLTVLEQTADSLTLEIRCSKGTYIRSLVDEIGEALGCGAHVQALRRLGVGNFKAHQMLTLETLESQDPTQRAYLLLSPETALPPWPTLQLSDAAVFYLFRGQALALPGTPSIGRVRLVCKSNQQFLGVGQILTDGRVAPYRLMSA